MEWDPYFFNIADVVSEKSKDPITKVGAVIVSDENRILSTGYNGFPLGVKETENRWGRIKKHDFVIHAEENALLFLNSREPCTLYVTLFPCFECAKKICQSNIRRVVAAAPTVRKGRNRIDLSYTMFKEKGVEVCLI